MLVLHHRKLAAAVPSIMESHTHTHSLSERRKENSSSTVNTYQWGEACQYSFKRPLLVQKLHSMSIFKSLAVKDNQITYDWLKLIKIHPLLAAIKHKTATLPAIKGIWRITHSVSSSDGGRIKNSKQQNQMKVQEVRGHRKWIWFEVWNRSENSKVLNN